jgi:antitoxin component of MazEF toxin-antitoxin module
MNKTYTITLEDVGDDSGDVMMPIPDEILSELNWEEGDTLNITVENKLMTLTKVKNVQSN